MISQETETSAALSSRLGEMLEGFHVTQALYVAAKLNIFDVLRDGPKTSSEIADAVGAHEPSLRRLLAFLTLVDILTRDAHGRFAATPMGELLRPDHPKSERPTALFLGSAFVWRPWGELYESIVTGQPAFDRVYGEPFFEYLAHSQHDAEVFNAAMSRDSSVSAIVDAYDFSGFGKIVDVGGGQGSLLQGILERYPEARGVVYDLPSVVAETLGIKDSAVGTRSEVVGGDMFQSVPAGGDVYILKRIVHDWGDAEAVQILRNCRLAMSAGGKLLLVERIIQPSNQRDPATWSDLVMLVLLTGRERTEQEFRELLAAGGFQLTRIIPAGMRSIIEGVGM